MIGEPLKCPTTGRAPPAMARATGPNRAASVRRASSPSSSIANARPERFRTSVIGEEPLGALDELQRRRLALVAQRGPADETMATEHQAAHAGMRVDVCGDGETQLEPRPSPVEPAHVGAVALPHEAFSVGGGREGDDGIGMGVVDVVGVEQRMKWCVDRRRRTTRRRSGTSRSTRRGRPRARRRRADARAPGPGRGRAGRARRSSRCRGRRPSP